MIPTAFPRPAHRTKRAHGRQGASCLSFLVASDPEPSPSGQERCYSSTSTFVTTAIDSTLPSSQHFRTGTTTPCPIPTMNICEDKRRMVKASSSAFPLPRQRHRHDPSTYCTCSSPHPIHPRHASGDMVHRHGRGRRLRRGCAGGRLAAQQGRDARRHAADGVRGRVVHAPPPRHPGGRHPGPPARPDAHGHG